MAHGCSSQWKSPLGITPALLPDALWPAGRQRIYWVRGAHSVWACGRAAHGEAGVSSAQHVCNHLGPAGASWPGRLGDADVLWSSSATVLTVPLLSSPPHPLLSVPLPSTPTPSPSPSPSSRCSSHPEAAQGGVCVEAWAQCCGVNCGGTFMGRGLFSRG